MATAPTTNDPQALMIVVDWQITPSEVCRGLCARLTCGHFTTPCSMNSSQWDFPDDVHVCVTCGAEVQFDLKLQAMLYAQFTDAEAPAIPHEDQSLLASED